ncbi:hypothetical protein EW146_g2049 [Bondarzewia mesenterica]|uniref:ribonuclease T2 n=1 Tax=Bondarzewia mesenterica TaxID=1095465 RepID=A0A4S4M215_9AGAM|nr:hypothetical protein EW146_g2049 [Bondarzewia mesenterica]
MAVRWSLVTTLVASSIVYGLSLSPSWPVPNTFPSIGECASEPLTFSCENTTTIKNTCCSPTPGGLVLQTQFWDTYTGFEKYGQLLPKDSWTIHGLWPDNCDGSFEQYCDLSRQFDPHPSPAVLPDGTVVPPYTGPGLDTFVAEFGRFDLLEYMEKYWVSQGSSNADFWAHEFSKHATCTSTFDVACYGSGYKQHQDVVDFFLAVTRAFRMFPTFDMLAASGIVPSNKTTYGLGQIQNALKAQTGSLPYIGCGSNGTVIQEVWYFNHVMGTEQFGSFKSVDSTTKSSCSNTTGIHYFERTPTSEHRSSYLTAMINTLSLEASDFSTKRTLSNLSLTVAKSKRVVVVTGAGISCSCGIPDFRSSDGLYALVKKQYPDVVLKGRDLFDAALFRDSTSTSVFYTFISQLKQSVDTATPSPTHHFIKTLDAKKRLLRSYTQNIDGLEERAGLLGSSSQEAKVNGKGKSKIKTKEVRNVQLHGDIHRVRCTFCSADLPCTREHLKLFDQGLPPDCPECTARSEARLARSARPLKVGTLRPAIVLYDEAHPLGDDIGAIQTADIARKPDLLIIMGTSLKVHGFKKLVKDFAKAVHANAPTAADRTSAKSVARTLAGKVIFVNKTAPGSEWNGIIDYHVDGETDAWVERVVDDWKKARPVDWETQKTLVATAKEGSGAWKVVKEVVAATKGKKGKKPLNLGMENIRPEDDVFVAVPSAKNPPSSPSKRRQSTSHYSDVECSPSKKHLVSGSRPNMAMEERGLLFGDTTNSKANDTGEGPVDVDLVRVKSQSTLRRKASKPRMKMELVLPARSKSRVRKFSEAKVEADVFS